jgi:hypothetical protein
MTSLRSAFGLAAFLSILAFQAVAEARVQFSADAYQTVPQSPPRVSRMYVGDGRLRMEYDANGQQAVEISAPAEGLFVLLLPQQRSYMERKAAALPDSAGRTLDASRGPCGDLPNASCKALGSEPVNGRDAEKWEMVVTQDGRQVRALYWLDQERNLPLKVFAPDGTVTELHMIGVETLGGRSVEKWSTRTTRPDGQVSEAMQWYDPELRVAIREEFPGGFVRELRNIQVGAQPATLFEVPAGYARLPNPAPPGAPRTQQP